MRKHYWNKLRRRFLYREFSFNVIRWPNCSCYFNNSCSMNWGPCQNHSKHHRCNIEIMFLYVADVVGLAPFNQLYVYLFKVSVTGLKWQFLNWSGISNNSGIWIFLIDDSFQMRVCYQITVAYGYSCLHVSLINI